MAAGHGAKITQGAEEIELALICDRFGVLPDAVLRQDAYTMRRVYALVREFDRIKEQQRAKAKKK
jgi:hypothetical protein